MPWSEERRASSVLNYDLEKALSRGLVKSHLEYHSQVRASQLHKEGSGWIGGSSETSTKNDKGIGRHDLCGKIDAPDYLSISIACQRDD